MNRQHQKTTAAAHRSIKSLLLKHGVLLAILLQTVLPAGAQYSSVNRQQYTPHRIVATSFTILPVETPGITKEALLTKSRNQKTVAWTLLGAGLLVTTIGIASYPSEGVTWIYSTPENRKKADRATFIALAGSGLSLGSIPLFIASARNKRRARLAVSSQQTSALLPSDFQKNIPCISASFSIGK